MKAMLNAVIKLAATVAFAISLTGCGEPTASVGKTVVSGTADIGGAYSLVNQDGEAVSESSAHGKPQLIYFGSVSYTHLTLPTILLV